MFTQLIGHYNRFYQKSTYKIVLVVNYCKIVIVELLKKLLLPLKEERESAGQKGKMGDVQEYSPLEIIKAKIKEKFQKTHVPLSHGKPPY